jgi:hypothetical protein
MPPTTYRLRSRHGVVALVAVLLGIGGALLSPATATANPQTHQTADQVVEATAQVVPGPPLPDPIVPEPRPAPAPAVPTPAVPTPAVPTPAVPTPAVPDPDSTAPGQPAPDGGLSCAPWDLAGCVSGTLVGIFRAVVTDVVNAALELVTDTLLQTPRPSQIPRLAELWQVSWEVAVALYGVVILVGAVIVMAHHSVQTQYGMREIAPRLVVGFIAGWLTLPLADMAVQVANAVSDALLGPPDVGGGLRGLAELAQSTLAAGAVVGGGFGAAWVVLALGLMLGIGLLALLFGYVLRVVATIALIAAAPLVVMWHALPQTDGLARWWWRALGGVLGIQIVQAIVLSVAGAILLPDRDGGSLGVLGLASSGWVTLLVLAVLLWVLVKIPGWMWSMIRPGGGGRRSLLGTAVRAAIVWKTGGLLRGALTGGAGRAAGAAGATRQPGGGAGPSTHPPVVAGGRRRRPVPRREESGPQSPSADRAVLGRDGQWRLPITARRVARRDTRGREGARPDPVEPVSAPGPGQLRFPASGVWPEDRPVAGRDGQYRLPIPTTRRPRPTPAPAGTPSPGAASPAAPAPRPKRARQLSFDDLAADLDPFRGNRPLAGSQYPLPLPGLTRQPRPADRPRPRPAPPRPAPARPLTGQTRLPIPAAPPRAAPPRAQPPAPRRPRQEPPRRAPQPPTPPQPPPPSPPSPSSSPRRARPSAPRRRPGQENT